MWSIKIPWNITLLLAISVVIKGQGDSLQSALNALNRRQRDLGEITEYNYNPNSESSNYFYVPDDKEELEFLKHNNDEKAFQKVLLEYLGDGADEKYSQSDIDEGIKKRISSSFRERIENDNRAKERQELAELLLDNLENENQYNDDNVEYYDILQQLSDGYPDNYPEIPEPRVYQSGKMSKRTSLGDFYPNLGYGSVGMKKRSRYFEPDGPRDSFYLLNYTPNDQLYDRFRDDKHNQVGGSLDAYGWNRIAQEGSKRSSLKSYPERKRFSLAKRSSPMSLDAKQAHHQKRSSARNSRTLSPTDPEVAKALSSVFGPIKPNTEKPKKTVVAKKSTTPKAKLKQHDKAADLPKLNVTDKNDVIKNNSITKEFVPGVSKEEALNIKKKSVNWEDYFGYDRKKKSNVDNEWLLERYHKAVETSAEKRNKDYPLLNFRNHDDVKMKSELKSTDKKNEAGENTKLEEIDFKLKGIEDSVIDDALKYTGAHVGTTDPKEIQAIKDRIINRLAAAYSLEKMRQALGDYRKTIEKQRLKLKESGGDIKFENKRVSVPRKQAVDEDRAKIPEGDNDIKCAHEGEDCDEQNYKTPKDILEEQSFWTRGDCPKVQRACNDVASVLGNYGKALEYACNIHQACLLCEENSWFAPTRQCNLLFLAKADEICDEDRECQRIARHSVRYLLDINRSLRAEQSDCELVCSNNRR